MSFINIETLQEREIIPGFNGRFLHTANLTLAYWDIKAGSTLPEHHHIHEMIVNLIDGEFEMTIGGKTQTLKPGIPAAIPGNVPHSGKALTDCRIIDVFYPIREDYQ
jgi:quercetin dioxygenase-like cupin family protein